MVAKTKMSYSLSELVRNHGIPQLIAHCSQICDRVLFGKLLIDGRNCPRLSTADGGQKTCAAI